MLTLAQLRLQYNADPTKYKSSFGDDMAVIYKAWFTTSEQAKLNLLSSKKNFINFLNKLLPSNTSLASWLPLLKHAEWSYWMQQFVSHPWGRHTLVASQVTVAFACHHPRPSFQLFDDVSKWFERNFPGVYHLVDAEDMNLLISISENFATSSNLRALFYPVWPSDFAVTARNRVLGAVYRMNVQTLKDEAKNKTLPNFPALSYPVSINGVTYHKRRPDFLTYLSDTQYHELFSRLRLLDEKAAFPTWYKLMRDDTQHTCQVFSSVMRQVLTWIDPAAKPPGSNSPNVIPYTWDQLVETHAMPRRTVGAGVHAGRVYSQQPEAFSRRDGSRHLEALLAVCKRFPV